MDIFLARHGQTTLNAEKKFYGILDPSLTQIGRRQALQLKKELGEQKVDYVFVSEKQRTIETAALIFPEKACIVQSALNEISFGLWEGLTAAEISRQFPDSWIQWMANPLALAPEQGESFEVFQQRVCTGWQQICQVYGNSTIAMIGHLGALRVIGQQVQQNHFFDNEFPQGEWVRLHLN